MFNLGELLAKIQEKISSEDSAEQIELLQIIKNAEPVDLARASSHLYGENLNQFLELLVECTNIGAILSEMEGDFRLNFLLKLKEENDHLLKKIFAQIDIDDIVRIYEEIPEEEKTWVLGTLPPKKKDKVLQLLWYDEGTAGRVMTTEFLQVRPDNTVEQCFDILKTDHTSEMVYYLYVTDQTGQLQGVLSLRDILKNKNRTTVKEIMSTEVITAELDMDQENVASLVERYNLSAIPVIDHENKVKGLITVDDVIDIIRQESDEDILKLAGTSDGELLSRSPWQGFLMRIPWLLVAFFGGYLSIQSMNFFSGRISNFLVLSFVPIITGMGGNVGSQSSIIIVRGLAVGKILTGSIRSILFKEIGTGALSGVFFGFLLALVSIAQFSEALWVGVLAGCGILFSMTLSALVGSLIPLILQKFGADPAVSTGPFVTMSIDNISLLTYLGMAYLFVG